MVFEIRPVQAHCLDKNADEALTSTSSHVLPSGAFRVFCALIQSRGDGLSSPPHEELHTGSLCGPSPAPGQSQTLALHLVQTELVDAVIDEGDRRLFLQNCHLFFGVK